MQHGYICYNVVQILLTVQVFYLFRWIEKEPIDTNLLTLILDNAKHTHQAMFWLFGMNFTSTYLPIIPF